LKITLNASSGTTMLAYSGSMLVYYLTWMMEPIAGLVFGCLFTLYISSSQEILAERRRLFWVMLLSAALLVSSSIIFFVCIPRLVAKESSSTGIITLSTIFTVICFAAMMISINGGYTSAMNLMAKQKVGNAEHYGLESGLNAVGQMIAMGIITIYYFGLNNNNNNNSIDNAAPAILRVGFVFISIFIILSLTFGQYWPCCGCRTCHAYWPYNEYCCICSQHWPYKDDYCICSQHWLVWEPYDEQPFDDGGNVEYVANEVHIWPVFLFVIACWIALFAFLPWSVDWYASTYYSPDVGSPEYNIGVEIALWARFYQQLVMGACSFLMLFISKLFFKNSYRSNKRRQEKLKFRAIWIFTLIGLTIYSGCLLVAAFTDSPDLAYSAFVMSGIGMAAIFPLNGLQTYHIFSLNVKKREYTTTIMDNDNNTVAASPFTCTDYYDHRQKINAAAMIGQIIILSVTYFAFHFNYKWVLVTGSAAAGTAIFLGMLLIIVTPYKFEKCDYYDRVSVDDPDPIEAMGPAPIEAMGPAPVDPALYDLGIL
jgi:hypothetical protein